VATSFSCALSECEHSRWRSVTRCSWGCILFDAAIGARERVYEPGQDRKIATVLHVSVMRFWSPYFSPHLEKSQRENCLEDRRRST
jgi:hypothetical protein